MAATIAAIAACVAVGVGVLNVILTAWLNARATHQGWLRERVHPLVVAVQAASHRQAMANSAILRSRAVGGDEDNLKPFKDESWVASRSCERQSLSWQWWLRHGYTRQPYCC